MNGRALWGLLLAACTPVQDVYGPLVDRVTVPLYTDYCAPAPGDWDEEVRVRVEEDLVLAWEALCYRDGLDPDYFNLRVSWAEDPTDDFWVLWYLRPTLEELDYGQDPVPGAEVAINLSYPEAELRVAPRPLTPGDYQVQVDALRGSLAQLDPDTGLPIGPGDLSITSGRVLVHVVED